jgi:Ca2+-binding EF-hand superfamily protein
MKKITLLLIALWGALLSTTSAQTSAPAPAYLSLATLDRNADQQVSWMEFRAMGARAVAARFAGIDTNRDGALSPAEIEVARAASAERLRKLAPDDPVRAEYAAMPTFVEMDADGNSRLDPAEFGAAQERSLRQRFQRLDADGDGALSTAEFEPARKRFLEQVGRPPEE